LAWLLRWLTSLAILGSSTSTAIPSSPIRVVGWVAVYRCLVPSWTTCCFAERRPLTRVFPSLVCISPCSSDCRLPSFLLATGTRHCFCSAGTAGAARAASIAAFCALCCYLLPAYRGRRLPETPRLAATTAVCGYAALRGYRWWWQTLRSAAYAVLAWRLA